MNHRKREVPGTGQLMGSNLVIQLGGEEDEITVGRIQAIASNGSEIGADRWEREATSAPAI
jgi:hypothetical protein